MTRRRIFLNHFDSFDIPPIINLWLLRLLVPLGGHRRFIDQQGIGDDTLAEAVGLSKWVDADCDNVDPNKVRAELRKLHQAGELAWRDAKAPRFVADNVARLADLVGLSGTDRRILEFAVLIHTERLLDSAADLLGQLSSNKVFHVLAVLLDLPEPDIRAALNAQGALTRSGLVSLDLTGTRGLCEKLDLLSNNFADRVSLPVEDPAMLLRGTISLSASAQLHLSDYDHIASSVAVLRPYLKQALESSRKGVNVFLYGLPGTGKSELARTMAQELGCELFEIASENDDGDPILGEQRLRAFRAAQSFFSKRRVLILFDEVEDIFNDGSKLFGRKSTGQNRKAWINRALEENPVPAFWLSNCIDGVDPAFIRRFDMVFELPVPPQAQRERIVKKMCSNMLDAAGVKRFAESEFLAPALVARASSVIDSIHNELGGAGAASALELIVQNTLKAQGHKAIRRNDPNRPQDLYDPAFIHADANLVPITTGLIKSKSGRLCLYGPPGTGKTAYGRWLSEQMGVPLTVKKASDLMSKWVGDNEKNIADAFNHAEQDGALLLIDEVDSFLQDRHGAQAGWEVTLVNEMLTQMEQFPGVFIATTNLMNGLDPAALRRFDLKVKFDFLKPEQAWGLMQRYCAKLTIDLPQPDQQARLTRLHTLTPGDFAVVLRQSRFRPIANALSLIEALEAECAVKPGAKASIGFM